MYTKSNNTTNDHIWLQNLIKYLQSDILIEKNDENDHNEITIRVENIAPASYDGPNVVFIGVGLRIILGKRRERNNLLKLQREYNLKVIEGAENEDLRRIYGKGVWVIGEDFPDITTNERTFGKVLFPSENVVYKMAVPSQTLPYLDIRIEGQVSRRHLFHFSYPITQLQSIAKPLFEEIFSTLDKIEIHQTLTGIMAAAPELRPQITLADLDAFRKLFNEGIIYFKQSMNQLNDIYDSAPNQDLRDFIKLEVGRYITRALTICRNNEEAFSGRDTLHMKSAIKALEQIIDEWKEVINKREILKSRFGVKE